MLLPAPLRRACTYALERWPILFTIWNGNTVALPCSSKGWNDWRTDYIGSEQALDYNAGFTMALAAATELPGSFWTKKCKGALCFLSSCYFCKP